MHQVINVFDMYVNIKYALNEPKTISPDSAYWLTQEITNQIGRVMYCSKCKVNYYQSTEQKVKLACPFCKS